MPIIPKMMFNPEAIKNKIIPYAIPCIPWDMYIDTIGSIDISFTDFKFKHPAAASRGRLVPAGKNAWAREQAIAAKLRTMKRK
jgi:hypothetical protein